MENGSGSCFYMGKAGAACEISNSYFKNALDKGIRITGNNSFAKNCVFIVDMEDLHPDSRIDESPTFDGYGGGRSIKPIWLQTTDKQPSGTAYPGPYPGPTIENCDFIVKSIEHPEYNSYVNVIGVTSEVGGPDVRNCRFRNETSANNIVAKSPGGAPEPAMTVEGCSMIGSGSGKAVNAIDRPGSVVRNCCIDMPNGGQLQGVSTENISTSGCEAPDATAPDTGSTGGSGASLTLKIETMG
jgi:hypothetical protein